MRRVNRHLQFSLTLTRTQPLTITLADNIRSISPQLMTEYQHVRKTEFQ